MTMQDPVDELEVRELFSRAKIDERPGFSSDLRSRLLAQVGPAAQTRRPTPWWSLRVPRFAVAGVAVLAMLFGSTGVAAAGSLPGEPLFEVKRAAEEVALALAFDDDTRLERLADQTSARLAELRRVDDERARAAAVLESARSVERLAEAVVEAEARDAPRASASRASRTLEEAADVLRAIGTTLPAEAHEGIRRAIEATERRGPPEDRGAPPSERPGAPSERPTPPVTTRPPANVPGGGPPDRTPGPPSATPQGRPASGPPSQPPTGPPSAEPLRPPPAIPSPPTTGR